MRRRTLITGTLLGAAAAAVPLSARAATTVTVGSLNDLQKAIDRAVPGDRITLADGTYTVPSGGSIRVSGRNGTVDAPITILSQSRGGAVLQGERGFVFSDSGNITVSGFAFRQRTTLEIPASCPRIRLTRNDFRFADISGLDWVVVRGDDAKIDRNRFHDRTTEGIFLVVDGPGSTAMAQRPQILRNHFRDHSYSGANGGESIRLGVSSRALADADALVEYNLFERCDGDPEAVSVKSSGNTVRYNTIRDSRGGIVLRHGNGTTVEGNYLLGGTDGLRLYGNDHLVVNNLLAGLSGRALVIGSGTTRDHHDGESTEERQGNDACDRAVIAYNTLVGNARTLSGETRDYPPRDVVVADNILSAGTGSLVAMAATSGFTWRSNILWGAAANGTIPSTGYRRVDPLLRKESDGVYRLSAGSPAINAATLAAPAVTQDLDGHPRGSSRDIGADEYTTLAPLRRPLTPADVGPDAN
ncbi:MULTISPECIES: polysaccharide lyase 6 family protein [unclassified Kitasatospora]|uniref:polysaccharide lyase 6 family protein n=1 Tax=unclassified Kitasatospora TaxID=2633591 RepID=UPI00070B2137|nr:MULTISPECIES: polysaccharide lyase 6 family protein [unclassified Kitasatospora]KQV19215.1 lyase precursor [Kitasatospora sp. Root107]KRB77491.1 lyase precursor [Kitasatospora sp. Root187]